MAVQLRTPDDMIVKPEEKKKKKIFDVKKFAKLGPLALISAPAAAAVGGLSALRSDLRAPVLGIGGAAAGGLGAGPGGAAAGAKAGFALGGTAASAANFAEKVGNKEKVGLAEGVAQVGGIASAVPTGGDAARRKIATHEPKQFDVLKEGLIAANELEDPEQKKQALKALFPALIKSRGSNGSPA